MLGSLAPDGVRKHGLIEKFHKESISDVINQVARRSENQGLVIDAIKLFDLAGNHHKVVYLFVCLFICLFVCLFALFACIFVTVCLSVCLFRVGNSLETKLEDCNPCACCSRSSKDDIFLKSSHKIFQNRIHGCFI